MYGLILVAAGFAAVICHLVLYPFLRYLIDSNGLRRFPNMSVCSGISDFPYMLESSKGYRCGMLAALHKNHPVIRIGPNSLSYCDQRAIKDIYGHGTKCIKGDFYETLAGTHYHVADVIDKKDHQRKRKLLSSAYALKNLESWEFKVVDKVERLIKQFDTRCTEPLVKSANPTQEDLNVEFRKWVNFFTMEAIVDIGVSNILGFLDREHDETVAEGLDGSCKQASYRDGIHSLLTAQSHLAWDLGWYKTLWKFVPMVSSRYKKLIDIGKGFEGIVLHQTRKRLQRYQNNEVLDDFFQALLETKDGRPNQLPFGELYAEMSVMSKLTPQPQGVWILKMLSPWAVNAGSVTTAIAIQNALYLILRHKEVLQRVREEIDSVAGSDEVVIAYDKVKDLPYLRACLDESMRLFPPTSFGLPRKTPPEGCMIADSFIPGNVQVSISSFVAHRDEKVFAAGESFRPERWLGSGGKQLQPFFITFSAGARGCIGRNISYLEQTMLLSSLLHRYEMALPSPDWELKRVEHFNLVPEEMPLKIWRRTID